MKIQDKNKNKVKFFLPLGKYSNPIFKKNTRNYSTLSKIVENFFFDKNRSNIRHNKSVKILKK